MNEKDIYIYIIEYSCVLTVKRLLFNYVIWLTQRGCRSSNGKHTDLFRGKDLLIGLRNWLRVSYSPKVKAVLFLFLIKYSVVKVCEGVEIQLHDFFSFALDGGKWLVPRLGIPRRKHPVTSLIGGWVSSSTCQVVLELRTNCSFCQKSNPISTVV
jgi:hypothetical protein